MQKFTNYIPNIYQTKPLVNHDILFVVFTIFGWSDAKFLLEGS